MHSFRLLVACTLLTSAALAAPLPQAADPAAAPSVATDGITPATDFDPASFASGPDSSFASGAGPDGTSEESTPAITKDTDPITAGNSSSPGLPEVGADDFGNINGLLSGLSGLQANAGTSNGDDKDTNAALGSLTGTAAQPTGEGENATTPSEGASPVGLVAAAMTGSAIEGSSTIEPSSTDSAATAVAAVTPAPTVSPTTIADTNSTMASTNGTENAAAAASGNLTFDLAGFLSGAEFDPAATAPAGAIAAAAPTASA